jgi:RNA polymerase sigma-70 factor (subfamily 1)
LALMLSLAHSSPVIGSSAWICFRRKKTTIIPSCPQGDFMPQNSDERDALLQRHNDERGVELERLRPYLHLVARMHLDYRLRSLIDPEDVVHDVFIKALKNWDQCTGERKAWLRRILLNQLKDLIDKMTTQKENVDRHVELQHSSVRLEAILVADHSSPSQRAERNEELAHLAEALAKLPIMEQEVVILKRLHEQKLEDVSLQLGITLGQAAGLLYRGLERLNRFLTFPE